MLAVDWTQGIEDAWSDVASFVPKFLAALLIFVIGWIVARVIRTALVKVLDKVRFDEVVDKSGLGAPLSRAGYPRAAVLLGKILYFGLMLLVLQMAIGVFGQSDIARAIDGVVAFLPKLVVALVIVVITGAVARAVRDLVAPAMSHLAGGRLMTNLVAAAIWLIGGFAAVDQLGVARNVVDLLFQTIVYSLGLILVIKFGVGGIWEARDRFWPKVYDQFEPAAKPPAGDAVGR